MRSLSLKVGSELNNLQDFKMIEVLLKSLPLILALAFDSVLGYGHYPQQFSFPKAQQQQQLTARFPFSPQAFGKSQYSQNANNINIENSRSAQSSSATIGVDGTEFFDLSYTYDNNTIFYPGQRFDRFHLLMDVSATNRTPSNYEYTFNSFSVCFSEHGGTHIDAPIHFNRYGWRLAEIPLNRLVDVPTALIDVERHVFALRNPDRFTLELQHIQEHESKFGAIPQGALILIHFGWGQFWPDPRRYAGWDNSTAGLGGPEFTLSYPAVSASAADWLLRERKIIGLGSDTLSPDVGTTNPVVHILLLENQVYLLENVANLDYMVQRIRRRQTNDCDLRTFVLPLKSLGTGGPVRLVSYCKN